MPLESALQPHAISVSAAFELLTTTLRNPSRVDACARRMSVAADRIDQALEARTLLSEKIKFAKSRPDFLRAGIKFLTLNQTKKDWESMIDHLAQCRCSTLQSRRILHYPNGLRPDERLDVQDRIPIFDVVSTVSKCIILALSNLTQDKFHSGTTSSGKKIWPQSPEDLLPYGPNATLAGFVLWLNDPPEGVVIFKLAVRLALFYSPFSEKVFDAELVAGKAVLHLAVATVFYGKGDPSPRARLCRFTQPVLAVLQFFEDLTICDISAFFHVFIGGHQWVKKVFEPVRDILRTMPEEWNKTLRILGYIIGASQASFDEDGIISINVGSAADVRIIQDYPNDEGVEYLSRIIVEARSMGCWNVTCTSALGRGQLRVCRKCDLLRFCNEEASGLRSFTELTDRHFDF
ncbi:hypothetical protein CPB84DRAFT_1142075 [Gymnopilus junonius]|uniref:Uncharacterized protein n=1 Tax=Gymnopilus junonius TaxID=109634 RepID=A0A9P5NPF4_GYMJU|nr:hypothetical protein CPB84DRAFT_1142075 [Gymnopilus junonius]